MKLVHVILVILLILALGAYFFPKSVGGPLCGPVCPSRGLFYWEKPCIGFTARATVVDSYSDTCYGFTYGEPKCIGLPFDMQYNEPLEMDCNFPCSDQWVRSQCTQLEILQLQDFTVDCFAVKKKCEWH